MKAVPRSARVLLPLGLVVMAGCSFLSPREDPSRFFLLTSPPVAAPAGSSASAQGTIGVGPLELPVYLDRPQLVTRIDDNEVAISEFERWAEPLQGNFLRVLAMSLSGQLGSRRVVVRPQLVREPLALRIPIQVRRFERDSAGTVELWARWRVEDVETRETLEDGESRISQPSSGGSEASVAAMSEALATLGREIAAAIRAMEQRL